MADEAKVESPSPTSEQVMKTIHSKAALDEINKKRDEMHKKDAETKVTPPSPTSEEVMTTIHGKERTAELKKHIAEKTAESAKQLAEGEAQTPSPTTAEVQAQMGIAAQPINRRKGEPIATTRDMQAKPKGEGYETRAAAPKQA
jgi:hypothetical protein